MTAAPRIISVSVPDPALADDLALLPGVEIVPWSMDAEAPRPAFDIVVPPYLRGPDVLRRLDGVRVGLVQSQSIGFDGVDAHLPDGNVFANASSVHEASTAELAVGLAIAAQRAIPRFVHAHREARWLGAAERDDELLSLADRRVLIVGFGGVGRSVAARLSGFEAEVSAVATRARVENGIRVDPVSALPDLLPQTEIVILTLPGGPSTARFVDDPFLSALPDGALLINVGRGSLVDTDALVDHLQRGRIRAALDVVDPEPLPADHPLWRAPGLLLTPHIGGDSSAMRPRIARLVRTQIERMQSGEEPVNVVLRT